MLADVSRTAPAGATSIHRVASSDADRTVLDRGFLLIVLSVVLGVVCAAAGCYTAGRVSEGGADHPVVIPSQRGHDGSHAAFWLTRSTLLPVDAEAERGDKPPMVGTSSHREDGRRQNGQMMRALPASASGWIARALPIYLLQRIFRI